MTEELKQIAEIVNSLSGDAATAFGWFIAYLVLKQLLLYAILTYLITNVYRFFRHLVNTVTLLKNISQELGLRTDTIEGQQAILEWVRAKNQPAPKPTPPTPAPAPEPKPEPPQPKRPARKHNKRYRPNGN